MCQSQEVGGNLFGEHGLVVMTGAELMERYKTYCFDVFDAIPFSQFGPLL
jgi:hypothetical protein